MKGTSVVIGGVGGQGVVLIARILAEAALLEGVKAQMSEVHGMSQRYGSVVSTVRFGPVQTPMVKKGEADAIVGLEPLETVRLLPWAYRKTVVVTAITPIRPLTVVLGQEAYPALDDLQRQLQERAGRVLAIDADRIARSIGNEIVANSVLLGAVLGTKVIPVPLDAIRKAVVAHVPPKLAAMNLEALDIGYGITIQDEYSIQFA
ncbi:MAG TPA: indolepyruvate oxidoreductase subunit beta [Thermoplasmata archaeon]|jgi:indolepyruvate ferredoxin oxidoreductase beta subunit